MSKQEGGSAVASRRQFLQRLGVSSGAVALAMLGELTMPEFALGVCEPPGTPGAPQRTHRDCRPIRPRRPASTLSNPEIQKLKDAYQAMRALDTSDPNDPRGFQRQANVHCWSCAGEGPQVHFSWQFFAWHRAYLYFHERILGKLIGDMEFRLPYWDWDITAHRRIPSAYTSPSDATNPLWNGTRVMSPTEEIPDEDVGQVVMEAALTAGSFGEFGGTATVPGILEQTAHGSVHVDVGGNMGFFSSAARDPVFYAHHSNVDKVWSDWNKASSTHTNPTDPTFLNLSWNFYDENKVWRSITAAQVLNHENQLRYIYGPSTFIEQLPCLLDWVRIPTEWLATRQLTTGRTAQAKIDKVLQAGGRVRLHLLNLLVPTDKSAVYRLYGSSEAANADEGTGSAEYLGSFAVVLSSHEKHHPERRTRNIVVNLSSKVVESVKRAPGLKPAMVERGLKPEARRVIPVQARDIQFSAAEIER